ESGVFTIERIQPQPQEPVTEPPAAPPIAARKLPREAAFQPADFVDAPAAESPARATARWDQVKADEPAHSNAELKSMQPARRSPELPAAVPAVSSRLPQRSRTPSMAADAASTLPPAVAESETAR